MKMILNSIKIKNTCILKIISSIIPKNNTSCRSKKIYQRECNFNYKNNEYFENGSTYN